MAGSVNKVILIGNLGKDPEIRVLENGAKLARFPIATSESYKDKSGNRVENTEWHNIVVWRGLADVAEKYCKKGDSVFIEGKIKSRTWQDDQGNTRYNFDIVADNMTMLGSPRQNSNMENSSTHQGAAATTEMIQSDDNMEDDLPF